MKILLTGSSSHLARALLPRLCMDPRVERVAGIDIRKPAFNHPKFHPIRMDIRDSRMEAVLPGHDALIHCAFVVLRGRMSEKNMYAINVAAGQTLFGQAQQAGIPRLMHLSSASVYGHGEDLPESAPLSPLPRFLYAHHKAELEEWLAKYCPEAIVLRPHIILGPNAQSLLRHLLHQPFFVRLPDPQPRLECIHEDDVSDAIMAGLFADSCGPFNLATPGTYSFREVIQSRHRFARGVSLQSAQIVLTLLWRLFGIGGEPAWVDGIRHTLTLDCSRARKELGWVPRHNARDTLAQM
jgi:UDP-glucose 4-epimerase